jgi:hypothetical protein
LSIFLGWQEQAEELVELHDMGRAPVVPVIFSPQICRHALPVDAREVPPDLWPKQVHRLHRDGEDRVCLSQIFGFAVVQPKLIESRQEDVPHVVRQIVQAVSIWLAPAPLAPTQRREAGEHSGGAYGEVGAH